MDGLAYFAGGILGGMAGSAFVKSMSSRMNAVKEGKTVTKSMSGAGAKRGTVTRKRLSLIKRRTVQSSSVSKPFKLEGDLSRALGSSSDWSGDAFIFAEVDSVGIFGPEAAVGAVWDTDNWRESGIFISYGGGGGSNVGWAIGGGYVRGDIEGISWTLDINAKKIESVK